MHGIDVMDGGFFTTVQDLGRFGYQRYGVPVSGAMDLFALRAANLLVGNPRSAAALEITLAGPRLQFTEDAVIAMAGADIEAELDGRAVPAWRAIAAPEGAVLALGSTRDGLRAYLAVSGGIDVPLVLGSRSTFPRAALGGFHGRPLRGGDFVAVFDTRSDRIEARSFPVEHIPRYGHDHTLRVVLGPQDDAFTEDGLSTFLSSSYVVTPKSDRIGCRLEGPRIAHKESPDIISDGVPFGAVQIAGDGLPMILVADRGTTGGYTKVATVIGADLPRLAQALPGDRVGFRAVSLADGHRAAQDEAAVLERVSASPPFVFVRSRFEVRVNDMPYAVAVGLHLDSSTAHSHAYDGDVDVVERDRSEIMHVAIGASPAAAAPEPDC
jgi:antagonist of KipI